LSRREDFQDREWADCLGSSSFSLVSLAIIPWVSGIEVLNALRASSPGPTLGWFHYPRRDLLLECGAGGALAGVWGCPQPREHSQARCISLDVGAPPMPAGVRGILFNVLGGGRYMGIGRGRYSFSYKETNS